MSSLLTFTQNTIDFICSRLGFNPEDESFAFSFAPVIKKEEKDPENPDAWLGIQFLYETKQNPPTRLQLFFSKDEKFSLLESFGIKQCGKNEIRKDWVTEFDTHPDPMVKAIVLELLAAVEANDFDEYAIPWHHELQNLPKELRDSLAGVSGFFFPVLHFNHTFENIHLTVRCEPVVELTLEC